MQPPPTRTKQMTARSNAIRLTLARRVSRLTVAAGILALFCALSAPTTAKTLGELRVECGQAITLSQNPSAVGVDIYQIATCFAYIEAHLDLTPALFCLSQDLAMSAIAEHILDETRAYGPNANASDALVERLRVSAPCPERAR